MNDDICTCDDPCCQADVGIGVITCGSQHCAVHGEHAGEQPRCFRCGRTADQLDLTGFTGEGETNAQYIREQEGTYNPDANTFACDPCYIAIGMPAYPAPAAPWRAPAYGVEVTKNGSL